MSLFTQCCCAAGGEHRARVPERAPEQTARCLPRFAVVLRHTNDDDAASHKKTVTSLLFHTMLDLGLKGCEVVEVGAQRSRWKEPPGEGSTLRRSPGGREKGAVPWHEVDSGLLSGSSAGTWRRPVSPGQVWRPRRPPAPQCRSSLVVLKAAGREAGACGWGPSRARPGGEAWEATLVSCPPPLVLRFRVL